MTGPREPTSMPFPTVELFSKPGDPHCDRLREYLAQQEIEFTDYNIQNDHDARGRLLWLTGRLWVPTLLVETEAIIGFDRTKLDELFDDIRERLADTSEPPDDLY
jgi:glutaredoxin